MDAISEYKKRRKARVGARAVEAYRARRRARIESRFDDEEENQNQGKSSGGHGNTRIPFGLCLREGIDVDPKWTPKDAWEALAGKGYSAGEVYKELRATGKVPAKKSTRKPVKLEESHFPAGMTSKVFKKNTMEFAGYINDHCEDPDVTDFLSCGGSSKGVMKYGDVVCKRSMSGEGAQISPVRRRSDGALVGMEVKIPSLASMKEDRHKAAAVRSFAHEWTHYLDVIAGNDKGTASFSGADEALKKALDANDGMKMSDKVKANFAAYNDGYKQIKDKYDGERKEASKKVAEQMFGDNKPEWIKEDGSIDYRYYWTDYDRVTKYKKAVEKAQKEIDIERRKETRAYMDGSVCLQGIYDAMSKGKLRANGTVKYGHSERYYHSDKENPAMEILADYVALKSSNPKMAQLFIDDKPEVAAALDNVMVGIEKKLRGTT